MEWGNVFLGQNEFPVAIEKFDKAVSLADGSSDDGARDALINGRIQWAASLSAAEDFKGALDQLNLAKESAQAESSKKSVDAAFSNTYLAFSNSTGPQARVAMRQAIETMCKQHKKPELPIFGLKKDALRLGIHGGDAKLPENLAAKTPGEIHYVVCVEVENKTIASREYKNIVFKTSKGYFYTIEQQFRVQLIWELSLYKADTGEKVSETTLMGATPPPFPEGANAAGTYFAGPPPSAEQLTDWLQSSIK